VFCRVVWWMVMISPLPHHEYRRCSRYARRHQYHVTLIHCCSLSPADATLAVCLPFAIRRLTTPTTSPCRLSELTLISQHVIIDRATPMFTQPAAATRVIIIEDEMLRFTPLRLCCRVDIERCCPMTVITSMITRTLLCCRVLVDAACSLRYDDGC